MQSLLNYWRLRLHAARQGAKLRLYGKLDAADLEFGLGSEAIFSLSQESTLGRQGTLSLDEGAECCVGKGCKIGRRWSLKHLNTEAGGGIWLGEQCKLEDDVRLIGFGQGVIDVGEHCFFGWGCVVSAMDSVCIGANTAIAEYVSIRDHNHVPDQGAVYLSPMQVKSVTIGKNVWIGAKATIVAGISIGDGAVIGANAVVTRDVPAGARVAGVPARPIRSAAQPG